MATYTSVDISNDALFRLGIAYSSKITALSDGTKYSDLCGQFYAKAVDQELRRHAWNFAKSRAKLSTCETATWATAASTGEEFGDAAEANAKYIGLLFPATTAGELKQVSINVATYTASGAVVARLYKNNSGSPGDQIGGDSDSQTISATGEYDFTWSSNIPTVAKATSYWVVLANADDTTLNCTLDVIADAGTSYASGAHDTVTSIADGSGSFSASYDWRISVQLNPLSGYDYLYDLPSDFLRMITVCGSDWDADSIPYELTDRKLACDSTTAYITYIRQETTVDNFDPLFMDVLAWRLARDLAISVTASAPLRREMGEEYKRAVRQAMAVDAIEDFPEQFPADSWITARGGSQEDDWSAF
jgi:hypothetical protein